MTSRCAREKRVRFWYGLSAMIHTIAHQFINALTVTALGTLVACGGQEEIEDPSLAQDMARAADLAGKLSEGALKKQVDVEAGSGRDELKGLGFPVQLATGSCKGESLNVMYNPYRNLIRFTFQTSGALVEDLRSLQINGKTIHKAPNPFVPAKSLLDLQGVKRPSVTLEKLTENYGNVFVGGSSVEISVGARTKRAKKTSEDAFRYVSSTHRGWKVNFFVFTREMSKAINEQTRGAKRATAELIVLSRYKSDAYSLRQSSLDQAKAVVARYDELYAAATKRKVDSAAIPFEDRTSSLTVRHEPACD